jgi:lysozyme family protein
MVAKNFDASFAALLVNEGGYSNDPHDPGKATNLGVTQVEYDAYRASLGKLKQSVRNVTRGEARDIYHRHYWNAVRGDELPSGVDYVVFDEAVNSGPVRSIKDVQSVFGNIDVDGFIGPITLHEIQITPPSGLINAVCDFRLGWLRRLRTWQWFGKGWTNRVAAVRATALKLVDQGTVK